LELGQPQKRGGFKPVNEIPTLPLDNCLFSTAIHNKQMINKTLHRLISTQKDVFKHYIKNE